MFELTPPTMLSKAAMQRAASEKDEEMADYDEAAESEEKEDDPDTK